MDEKNETGPAVEPKQARPHDELICELLDSRRPKTEREHAAAREIERLRDLCDDLYSDLLAAGSLAPRGCGAYALIQEAIKLRRDRWARKQAPNACSASHRTGPDGSMSACRAPIAARPGKK